jgi:hypothetical protein
VFRMAVQELTGREAIPGGAPAAGPTNSLSQEPHHG